MNPNSSVFAPLFSDATITGQFSDAQYIAHLLAVEVALAKVQSAAGLILPQAAEHIARAAESMTVNVDALRTSVDQSAVPVIALVKQLREAVGEPYGDFVHRGATSQDIMDTALVLQLRACVAHLEGLLNETVRELAQTAQRHRHTLMAGRTHAQQALPVTFGFKAAGWLAPLLRHQQRLQEIKPRLFVVQLGGGVGTLAAMGEQGIALQEALAAELGLSVPLMAWHTQRDNLAEFAGWLALVTGSVAKMAQDIILMAQSEVQELTESGNTSRGGSSTMPQKRNPVVSEAIITAARHNANLLASMHQAMIHEHERATGSWQIEWLALPQMLNLTAVALHKALFLSRSLEVNVAQMRANVETSHGLMLAEALDFALRGVMDRGEAQRIIREAVATALAEGRHLVDIVRERVDAPLDWSALRDEARYTGAADAFIDRVVGSVEGA